MLPVRSLRPSSHCCPPTGVSATRTCRDPERRPLEAPRQSWLPRNIRAKRTYHVMSVYHEWAVGPVRVSLSDLLVRSTRRSREGAQVEGGCSRCRPAGLPAALGQRGVARDRQSGCLLPNRWPKRGPLAASSAKDTAGNPAFGRYRLGAQERRTLSRGCAVEIGATGSGSQADRLSPFSLPARMHSRVCRRSHAQRGVGEAGDHDRGGGEAGCPGAAACSRDGRGGRAVGVHFRGRGGRGYCASL